MRLVGTLKDPHLGQKFSVFLNSKGIRHQIETEPNQDWGSDHYGTAHCNLWVVEEEQYLEAKQWFEKFKSDPFDPVFNSNIPSAHTPPTSPTPQPPPKPTPSAQTSKSTKSLKTLSSDLGMITSAVLVLCIILFVLSSLTKPSVSKIPNNLPFAPFVVSPINKELMYDYPQAYEYIDQAIALYGIEALATPSQLPPAGQALIRSYFNTPYWTGIYSDIVNLFRAPSAPWNLDVQMFGKIREGEIWRLITPCFLHYDIFHILFNMMWLIVLGRQMEKQLGIGKYILFILIAGILSNTAQYLMSGPNFIGYSGVICGMIAFIWVRQKVAPWEGYQLHSSTILFITVFVFAILGIQMVSFVLEALGGSGFSAGIANTAHISGGLVGFSLGKMNFFSWKR
jgi:rhomboid protease GlpG